MSFHDLEILFTPYSIGGVEIRNRFIMPAMQRGTGFVEGSTPTDAMIAYLRDRGEGGVGMIISEGTAPEHPSGYWQDVIAYLHSDRLGQWEKLISTVKGTGARFLLQLWHPGSLREVKDGSSFADFDAISPSGLIQENRPNGRPMTRQDLDDLKGEYVRAALNAKRLGADGVEIHACHGYLLYQFLWHETNLREDEYGGRTLAERSRYPAEIVKAIRDAVGSPFIISFRFSQFAEADYGARIAQSPEDLASMLTLIRRAGADCFHASSRRFYKPEWPDRHPTMTLAGWAKSMTGAVAIGVGSVGLDTDILEDLFDNKDANSRIDEDLIDIEGRVRRGEFDFISVGRAQIANPDFVNKIRRDETQQIVLFKKALHLSEFVEGWDMGAVEESRKIVAHDQLS